MQILDGKMVAKQLRNEVKTQIANLQATDKKPGLTVILVGNDPSSLTYVVNKQKACKEVGINSEVIYLDENISPKQLSDQIQLLNDNPSVDGILLQLPLPKHLNEDEFIQLIDPNKDVDGFHYINQGKMLQNLPTIFPCTPLGILELLDAYQIPIVGKNVCIVGTSNIVGKPLGIMLLNREASVDFCHKKTANLASHTKKADILISATGQKHLIKRDMVKPNAVIIDVGIVKDPISKKLYGDVDFNQVAPVVDFITPVPGGIGPMTVASLMKNTWELYKKHSK